MFDKEIVLGVLGLLGSLMWVVRALVGNYFKKAEELEELRKTNNKSSIENLESVLKDHSKSLDINSGQISELKSDMVKLSMKLVKNAEDMQDVREFAKRVDRVESELIPLGKFLTMIKERKP